MPGHLGVSGGWDDLSLAFFFQGGLGWYAALGLKFEHMCTCFGVVSVVRKGRSSALQKRHRSVIARSKPACHIFGGAIYFSLKWPDPMCFVVDHLVAIANGGADTIDNKAASHASCNRAKSANEYAPIIRRSGTLD